MLAAVNLCGDVAGLHFLGAKQFIDQRRFTHSARSGHGCGLSGKKLLQRCNSRSFDHGNHTNLVAALFVGGTNLFCRVRGQQILFVKTDNAGNSLALHMNQETVKQIEIRLGFGQCENNHRLVDIGHFRPD